MGKFQDLTGETFGRLTVISRAPNKGIHTMWKCRCSCKDKTIVTVDAGNLRSGNTQSCGCLEKERPNNTKHGKCHESVYHTWRSILQRCNDPNRKAYPNYGGRGIRVCERWLKFENFYEDVSKLPHFGEKGYTLDRINNNGNYEPSNVRWADSKAQNRNKRNNVLVEYQGEKMCLAGAAEKSGISYSALYTRYHRAGLRGEDLFKPVRS